MIALTISKLSSFFIQLFSKYVNSTSVYLFTESFELQNQISMYCTINVVPLYKVYFTIFFIIFCIPKLYYSILFTEKPESP